MSGLREIDRHPIEEWIFAMTSSLEHLRLTLISHHREAFEQSSPQSFDPSVWLARALDAEISALIQTFGLYERAARLADEVNDVEF